MRERVVASEVASIAVVRALRGVGDLLCAVPALRALRRAFPAARLVLVGLPETAPLIARFAAYVDELLPFPGWPGIPEVVPEPAAITAFLAGAQSRGFDLALQAHGSGRFINAFVALLGARRTAGFCLADDLCPDPYRFLEWRDGDHEVRRLLALLAHLGIPDAGERLEFPLTDTDRAEAAAAWPSDAPFACVHPGAFAAERRWPPERFAAVADALAADGLEIVLTGTAVEAATIRAMRGAMRARSHDLTGRLSLGGLAALLERSRLLLCNDTGVSHVAAAVGSPSVVVFSASDPRRWAPLDTVRHRALGRPTWFPGHGERGGGVPEWVSVGEVMREARAIAGGRRQATGDRRQGEEGRRQPGEGSRQPTADSRQPEGSTGATGRTLPFFDAQRSALNAQCDWAGVSRVLAVRLDNIGDLVLLSPALRTVKARLPGVHLALLTSPAGAEVAPLLPWVDEVLVERVSWQDAGGTLPLDPERERALVARLAAGGFDAALIFTSFRQSPWPPAYACTLAGVPRRIGQVRDFGGNLLSLAVPAAPDELHQAERNLHLLEQAGLAPEGRELELVLPAAARAGARAALAAADVDPARPYLVLAPGASCPARRYPLERAARVAQALAASGHVLVLVGAEREQELFRSLLASCAGLPLASLVGRVSIPELAAVIAGARLLVGNDSGPMHIADAFRIPAVITYSGTELESQWRPRASAYRLLRKQTECSPCYAMHCPYNLECLDIAPAAVVAAAVELLGQEKAAPAAGGAAGGEGGREAHA